ncbi:MAG: hypothetical protein RLZZ367_1783 [Bacteroidota bacterium]|jgi:glycosyltransferase involved in cell wall biosynthesis
MRIGFDAKRALNNGAGLGNYSRNLINALMRDYSDNDYLLFTPKAKDGFLNELQGDFKIVFPETKFQKIAPAVWRSYGVRSQLTKNRVDVFHGLSNEIPFGLGTTNLKLVVTIHDLLFLKDKQQYPFIDRQIYTAKTRYACKHADYIIAISAETKRDIVQHYGVDENKIAVIPPPIDEKYQIAKNKEQRAETVQKYKLPDKFILNVGSFYPRKNQKTLVEAFALIKDKTETHLVLVGGAGNTLPEIKALIAKNNLHERIHIYTGVSNDELPAIYQAASLFVFPALYEGFGMPVVEAMMSGIPAITTGGGAMQEAGGDAAIYTDTLSAKELAGVMLHALTDERLRAGLIERGRLHSQHFTARAVAAKTMQVYAGL